MASAICATTDERAKVLEMFRARRSKAEIAKELGKDKVWVKNALAKAIRELAHG